MSSIDASKLDPTALENWQRPAERIRCEVICLGRALMPDEDSLERTIATLILFGVWAAIVLGPMFTSADPPRYEIGIGTTIISWTVIGRMWGFEVDRLLDGIRISTDGGQPRDDDRED